MAAPNGCAGSVAASTIGGVVDIAALAAEPVDRPGDRELGGAEPGDEVAAAHLAPLLERLEHRVHAGEAALGALAERGLPGEHAVALEQLQGPGVGRLGGRRERARAAGRRATTGRRRPAGPMPGQPPGTRTAARPGARRAGGRPAPGRADEGTQRGERVVGDEPGPHEVPQRGQHGGVVEGLAGLLGGAGEVGPERRAPRVEVVEEGGVQRRRARSPRRGTSRRPAWSRKASRMRPSVAPMAPAPTHTTSPDVQSASRSAGSWWGRRTRRMSRSSADATSGAPCSWATTSTSASTPRRLRADAVPARAGSGRACAASTGSTSLRSAASERRRSWRSTSSSHHSRSTPSGRNSPRTTRPSTSSRSSAGAHRLRRHRRSGRRRAARGTDRGCGRSGRRGRAPGRATDSVQLAGQADGHGDAERVAQAAGVLGRAEALLAGDRREEGAPLGHQLVDPVLHGRARRRTAGPSSSIDSGPSRRSWSCSSSTSRASRPSTSRCSSSSRSASTSASMQLAQLLGAEQVAQQVAVEGERGGPALGQRRVARVHVDGDPAEHQRLGERRRRAGVSTGDEPHLAAAQVAQHLAERGHVEHVVEALARGLEEDRERRVLARHRRAGRPSAGAAARAACAGRAGAWAGAGPGPRTPGTGTRTSPCPAAARRSAPRSRRGR